MKVETNKLQMGVNMAAKAKASRSTIDSMMCILMTSKDGVLTIKGINNEYEMVVNIPCEGDDIDAFVDATMLLPIIGKLPDASTTITADTVKNQIVIRSGKARFGVAIKGNSTTFPTTTIDNDAKVITMDGAKFAQLLKGVVFAAGEESGQQKFMGAINVVVSNGVVKVAALDGHRVAIRRMEIGDTSIEAEANVPVDVVKTMISIMSGDITLKFGAKSLVVEQNTVRLSTRLVDTQFYDTTKFESMPRNITVRMNNSELKGALERAALVANVEKIPLILEFEAGALNVSAASNLSDMDETISAKIENAPSDWTRIGFSPKYFLDMLNAISDKEVVIEFINPKSPAFITGNGYCYLTLPINIKPKA